MRCPLDGKRMRSCVEGGVVPKQIAKVGVVLLGALLLAVVCGVVVAPASDRFRLLKPTVSDVLFYSDDKVSIVFVMLPDYYRDLFERLFRDYKGIAFSMRNETSAAIAVNWDRSSITLPSGQSSGVTHEGVKYMSVGSSIPPTTIAPGAMLVDSAIPARSVHYSSTLHEWAILPMGIRTGSQFGLYLALDVGGAPADYYFVFEAVEVATAPAPALTFAPASKPTTAAPTAPGAPQISDDRLMFVLLGRITLLFVVLGFLGYLLDGAGI